jgi:hypothetical protein
MRILTGNDLLNAMLKLRADDHALAILTHFIPPTIPLGSSNPQPTPNKPAQSRQSFQTIDLSLNSRRQRWAGSIPTQLSELVLEMLWFPT